MRACGGGVDLVKFEEFLEHCGLELHGYHVFSVHFSCFFFASFLRSFFDPSFPLVTDSRRLERERGIDIYAGMTAEKPRCVSRHQSREGRTPFNMISNIRFNSQVFSLLQRDATSIIISGITYESGKFDKKIIHLTACLECGVLVFSNPRFFFFRISASQQTHTDSLPKMPQPLRRVTFAYKSTKFLTFCNHLWYSFCSL